MKSEKWYQRRLAKYFEEHYAQYEDVAEYWVDPDINQWLFDIEFIYIDNFDEDRWNECSTGIHFFITRNEVVEY